MEETEPSFSAIRPLRPSDVAPLHALLIETNVFTAEEISIALELLHAVIDNPQHQDYVIRVYDDGEVLGYYCVGPTPATASTFDLYWIATKPSVHGKGIGRVLQAHAEELIRSRGGRLVVAETSSTSRYNKTRDFYLKAGYEELARIRDYYRMGDSLVVFGKYL
jgi:ribosomal protein S18 acetylase RimI-like enzyme